MAVLVKDFESVIKRLESNYKDCEISQTDSVLNIKLPLGEIKVKNNKIYFYVLNESLGKLDFESNDELYEEIEAFIVTLQEEGNKCNPTYVKAQKNLEKRRGRAEFAFSTIFFVIFVLYTLFDLHWIFLLMVVLSPLASTVTSRFLSLYSLSKDWLCPHCGAKLPIERKRWHPCQKYVSHCPECKKLLIDRSMIRNLRDEIFPKDYDDYEGFDFVPPQKRGRKVCISFGILVLISTLILGLILTIVARRALFASTVVNIVFLIIAALLGFLLLLLPARCIEEDKADFSFMVYEQKILSFVGIFIGFVGIFFISAAFFTSKEDVSSAVICNFLGISFLFSGIFMTAAYQNRALYVYKSHLTYVTSFGRKKDFDIQQISYVKLSATDSIKFFDENRKKLFSVERNMIGSENVFDWIGMQNIEFKLSCTLQRRTDKQIKASVITWDEAYSTPLHKHIKAIRIGLIFVFSLFAAGCILPLLMWFFGDLKISHTIYMSTLSPIPLLLYYLAFAPVLLLYNKPKEATEEWKSKYIKFPTIHVTLLSLFLLFHVYYLWMSIILQVADTGRFMVLFIAIAAILSLLLYIRTPKHMRKKDGLAMLILSSVVLCFSMTYGIVLLSSTPVEHYPAIFTDSRIEGSDEENPSHYLTVLLDDKKDAELYVTKETYDLQQLETPFIVCQKNNVFGIRLVRLHLPMSKEVFSSEREKNT